MGTECEKDTSFSINYSHSIDSLLGVKPKCCSEKAEKYTQIILSHSTLLGNRFGYL